ncbi:MAG: hypothetical protein P8X42_04260 [Calditrichaceae bacterium]|jgi:hypothetical protein
MDIGSIFGVSSDTNKIDKNNGSKRVKPTAKREDNSWNLGSVWNSGDKADIYSDGRELLTMKTDFVNYLDEVKKADSLSDDEINEIREKIANNYYFKPEVIDKVVDMILELPGFK